MKILAFLSLCLLFSSMLSGELCWQEPIVVEQFDNVVYNGVSLTTSTGNHLLAWEDSSSGNIGSFLNMFDQQYQPLWSQPLQLPSLTSYYDLIETSDYCFVITLIYGLDIKAYKFSPSGEMLWGNEGIIVFHNISWSYFSTSTIADNFGGVYISWAGESYNVDQTRIQHLDNTGTITYPSTGITLDSSIATLYSGMLLMADNSVLITWTANYLICVNRISPSGQFMWPQTLSITETNTYPRSVICSMGDNAFALSIWSQTSVVVQKFDFSGTALWTEPVFAFPISSNSYSLRSAPSSDQGMFVMTDHYVQKISASGEALVPGGMMLNQEGGYLTEASGPCPDQQGGCLVAYTYSVQYNTGPTNIFALKMTADGSPTIIPVCQNSAGQCNPDADFRGGNYHILWVDRRTGQSGIWAQDLDADCSALFQTDGIPVKVGSSGYITNVNVTNRNSGCAVVWERREQSYSPWNVLVQIYQSGRQPLYPEGGMRISPEGNRDNRIVKAFSSGDNTMVVWYNRIGTDYTLRAQLIGSNGEIMLPEGGVAITTTGSESFPYDVTCYQGDWYIIWVQNTLVFGQKISGTQIQWESTGRQLTQVHPLYNSVINSCRIQWPYLIWSFSTVILVKAITTDGTTAPGFEDWGLLMPRQYGLNTLHRFGCAATNNNLYMLMEYSRNDDELFFYEWRHTFITPDGTFLFDPSPVPVNWTNKIFLRGSDVYLGYFDEPRYYILKYNSQGLLISNHYVTMPGYTQSVWNTNGVGLFDEGNILLNTYCFEQDSFKFRHRFITPQWELITPVNNLVFSGEVTQVVSASVGHNSAWVLWPLGHDSTYSYSCGLVLNKIVTAGSAADDPNLLPALPQISTVYPNPFNPVTTIEFSIPKAISVSLTIYNLRGQQIRSLIGSYQQKGTHIVTWDGKDELGQVVSSGIYFARLKTDEGTTIRKLMKIK